MKVAGFWPAKSKTEERLLNVIMGYTIGMIALSLWTQITELYLDKGDFHVSIKIYYLIIKENYHIGCRITSLAVIV